MGLTNRHTDTRTGRTISVPWHFDSCEFQHLGRTYRIIRTELTGRTMAETVYLIQNVNTGGTASYKYNDLVNDILNKRPLRRSTKP